METATLVEREIMNLNLQALMNISVFDIYYLFIEAYQIPFGYFSIADSLKELEHRTLGWKELILKYDLGKSLSKEMWYKMADTKKKIWLHILKDEKCM